VKKIVKYKLPFVNKGKEFEIPKMTMRIHRQAMEQMSEHKKMSEEQYSQMFNEKIVLLALQEVDSSITIEDVETMHPDDYIDFFGKLWNSGKTTKVVKPFRKK
jgi:ribosomal protein L19E